LAFLTPRKLGRPSVDNNKQLKQGIFDHANKTTVIEGARDVLPKQFTNNFRLPSPCAEGYN